MKKKIIGIFVCMLLITTVLPISGLAEYNEKKAVNTKINDSLEIKPVGYQGNGEILDQSQTLQSGWAWYLQPTQWIAQGFKPTTTELTRVELYLYRDYDPPVDTIITVSIRNSLDGNDLTSTEIVAGYFTPNPKWVEFNFPDIQVIPEQSYYIVARSDCTSSSGAYAWACRFNNPYERGDAWISHDQGTEWIKIDFEEEPECDMCFMTYGINQPPNTPIITGETNGEAGTEYDYAISTIDWEGYDVWYYVDWGDGNTEEWIGPYASGSEVTLSHTWEKMRKYTIKVKAKDIYDFESDWAYLEVTMPMNQNMWFQGWLERLPLLKQLLDAIGWYSF